MSSPVLFGHPVATQRSTRSFKRTSVGFVLYLMQSAPVAADGVRFEASTARNENAVSNIKILRDKKLLLENELTLESFSKLEEDEELMPVPQKIIDAAKLALRHIFSTDHYLPFFTVPTRSGGVGLEYRTENWIVYYRFNGDGSQTYSLKKNSKIQFREDFSNPSKVPTVTQLLARGI